MLRIFDDTEQKATLLASSNNPPPPHQRLHSDEPSRGRLGAPLHHPKPAGES